jgi:hypothetical protein
MVVVQAWSHDGEPDHQIMPVIAVQARVYDSFSRPHRPNDRGKPHSAKEAEERGYWLDGHNTAYTVIVFDTDYGLCSLDDLEDTINTVHVIRPVPWPADEDERRLVDVITTAEAEAVEKERWYRARTAKPAPERTSA